MAFVLGYAPYMKLIHNGKSKNNQIDAATIASLLCGGALPLEMPDGREKSGPGSD
jgi:hypothetical protein